MHTARAALVLTCLLATAGTSQDLDWATHGGGSLNQAGRSVATFADGSFVVAGTSDGSMILGAGEANETTLLTGSTGLFVARYNADGTLAWAKTVNHTDRCWALDNAALADGSSLVTGNFYGSITFGPGELNQTVLSSASYNDMFVAKYASDGSFVYAVQATSSRMGGIGVDAFPDGSFVVTGTYLGRPTFGAGTATQTSLGTAGNWEIFVARYNADGSFAWARRAGSMWIDQGRSVATMADGTCIVTGYFQGTVTFGAGEPNQRVLSPTNPPDIFVAKYQANGSLAWASSISGTTPIAWGNVATFADGSSVLIGSYQSQLRAGATMITSSGADDVFLVRVNADGSFAWAKSAGSPGIDQGLGICAMPDGSMIATGSYQAAATFGAGEANQATLPASGPGDMFVARYNADGSLDWARKNGGIAADIGWGVAAFLDESWVVCGSFEDSATFGIGEPNERVCPSFGGSDMCVARYKSALIPLSLQVPAAVAQECDTNAEVATVGFVVDVAGTVPAGAVLTVTDVSAARVLLSQAASAGMIPVGPHVFPLGVSRIEVEILVGGTPAAFGSFDITVQDTVAPVLAGCVPVSLECEGIQTMLSRSLLGITASDASDPNPTVTLSPSAAGMGVTQVTATATDRSGNSSSCVFPVTVIDTTSPVFLVAPGNLTRETINPAGTMVAFDVVASDLCGSVSLSCQDGGRPVDPAGSMFGIGNHTVTCTASDPSGNSAVHSFQVQILYDSAPVIACPADIVAGNDPGQAFARVWWSVTATDARDPTVAVQCMAGGGIVQPGDAFPVGTTTVTCSATDSGGNRVSCAFVILVQDREAPVLSAPARLTLVTDAAGSPLTLTPSDIGLRAVDNCDPNPTVTATPGTVSPGITTVLCTATDKDGNQASIVTEITVIRSALATRFLKPRSQGFNSFEVGNEVEIKIRIKSGNQIVRKADITVDSVQRLDANGKPIAEVALGAADGDSWIEPKKGSKKARKRARKQRRQSVRRPGYEIEYRKRSYKIKLWTDGWGDVPGARFKVVFRISRPGQADGYAELLLINK
ncbi:MAG: HYR domain-containing protein [Planctomycetota bacterium]